MTFTQFDGRVLRPGTRVEIYVTLPMANRYGHYELYQVRAPRRLVKRTCRLDPRTLKRSACSRG